MLTFSSVWLVFGGVERWLNGINPHQAMPVDLCRLKRGTGREDFGGGSWWFPSLLVTPCSIVRVSISGFWSPLC
jgi:hypothetical protein